MTSPDNTNQNESTAVAENNKSDDSPSPVVRILNQFVRDMSFENFAAQRSVNDSIEPEVQVNINLNARKINNDKATDDHFEVVTKLRVNATNKAKENDDVFLIELDYAGLFAIENVPEEQMHPFLLIECPRLTFPFIRRIVSDLTRDGGFPPLNLELIDFMKLYKQELLRRAQDKAKDMADNAADPTTKQS